MELTFPVVVVWAILFVLLVNNVDKNPSRRGSLMYGGYFMIVASVIGAGVLHYLATDHETVVFGATNLMLVMGGSMGASFLAHGALTTSPAKTEKKSGDKKKSGDS